MDSDPLMLSDLLFSFEEQSSQAAMVGQVFGRGMPCKDIEAVQAEHLQSPVGKVHDNGPFSVPQSPVGEMRRQWTLFSPSDSYTGCSKRPRTLGYTIEDAKRACHRYISAVATESQSDLNFSESQSENAGCSKGPRTVGSNENLPKNISAVATESQSVSPVSSSVKNNSNCAEKKQEQYQTGPSMNPQSIAALRRRNQNREKFSSLEKRIPLRSKLDTAKMLEAAGNYVKFLEAQVHLLKSMPNGLGSAGTLNPPKGVGMSGSENVKVDSVRSGNLSGQEMLYVLLTSRAIQGKLFSEEKCVGILQQYQMAATAKGSNNLRL